MKKILLTAVIVSSIFLAACTNNEDTTNNGEEQIENTNSQVEVNVDTLSDAERELFTILNDIDQTVEVGTAGSSLKAVKPTSDLMNWAIGTQLVDEQIAKVVNIKLNSLTDEEKEEFVAQLTLLDDTYKVLLSENRDELLESSGNSNENFAWIDVIDENTTIFENMESLMNAAGVR